MVGGEQYLAGSDEGFAFAAHVVAEDLLVGALALAVARLNHELCGEDVGQLCTVAIAPSCHLCEDGTQLHCMN